MPQTFSQYRISDPVLTQIAHGYYQADSIAPFVAPVVPAGHLATPAQLLD